MGKNYIISDDLRTGLSVLIREGTFANIQVKSIIDVLAELNALPEYQEPEKTNNISGDKKPRKKA